MALTTGTIVRAAITELQALLAKTGRAGLTMHQMLFVFGLSELEDVNVVKVQEIADYFDALLWTQRVVISWSEVKILLLLTP